MSPLHHLSTREKKSRALHQDYYLCQELHVFSALSLFVCQQDYYCCPDFHWAWWNGVARANQEPVVIWKGFESRGGHMNLVFTFSNIARSIVSCNTDTYSGCTGWLALVEVCFFTLGVSANICRYWISKKSKYWCHHWPQKLRISQALLSVMDVVIRTSILRS